MTADHDSLSPENGNAGNVTLEELLRLKRAERPAPEFWAGFERDLRAKQLVPLMAKRPWWQFAFVPRAARAMRRLRLPVGAAAVLALGVVAANHYWETGAATSVKASTSAEVAVSRVEAKAEPVFFPQSGRTIAAVKVDALPAPPHEEVALAQEEKPRALVDSPRADVVDKVDASTQLTAMVPWGVGQVADVGSPEALASAHLLVSDPRVASMTTLPVTTLLAAPSVEAAPLRQAVASATVATSVARDLRKARILEGIDLVGIPGGAGPSRAVVAVNDLNEDQLSDSVRRVGVVGDRLTLRF